MRSVLIALAASIGLFAQAPANLSFELGSPGQTPQGWFMSSSVANAGYTAALVESGCVEGARCALISGPATEPGANVFGNLSQSILAAPHGMRRIRFRAAARVEGTGTRLQFWLRIDRRDGSVLYLENMNSRPVVSSQWNHYTIDANVTDEAERITLGFLLFGSGKAWIDDGSFTAIGTLQREAAEPAREITDAGIENITAFARLLGAVRFFHPSDGVTQQDWERFAISGVSAVESVSSPEELARVLQNLFSPVAPTVQVYPSGTAPPLPAELQPASREGLKLIRWRNYGVRLGPDSNTYNSARLTVLAPAASLPAGYEDPASPYTVDIAPGVTARVPLTLFANESGTMPSRPTVASNDIWLWATNHRATRLGSVVLAWSALQNFYPYFDITPVEWPVQLARALRSAAIAETFADYHATLELLIASLSDGHGSAGPGPTISAMLPLVWDWIEDGLIVTQIKNPESGIQRGDRILSIDGVPTAEILGWAEARTAGATMQWVRSVAVRRLAYCYSPKTGMTLEVEPYNAPGTSRSIEVACRPDFTWGDPRPAVVQEMEPGIFYVDIDRLTDADWRNAIGRLASASGIVFDLRGYPRTAAYLSHLTRVPITSAQWLIPAPHQPDQKEMRFDAGVRWDVRPAEPYLNARRVFLTGGGAISYAESVMGIVEAYKLAEIVGGPTAGTNGNINTIPLPANLRIVFTGMKVLKHDGSQHHGVGIQPTVPVARTRQGAAEGVDEVLQRGLAVAKGN